MTSTDSEWVIHTWEASQATITEWLLGSGLNVTPQLADLKAIQLLGHLADTGFVVVRSADLAAKIESEDSE